MTTKHVYCRALLALAAATPGVQVDVTAVDPCDGRPPFVCPHGVWYWLVPAAGHRTSWAAGPAPGGA